MNIRNRILFLSTAGVIVLFILGILGLVATKIANDSLQSMHQDRVVSLKLLKVVSDAYTRQVGDAVARMNNGESTTAEGLDAIYAARDSIQRNWRLYQERDLISEELAMVREAQYNMNVADQEIEGILHAIEILLEEGNLMLANRLGMIQGSIDPSTRQVGEVLDQLVNLQLYYADQEFKLANARFKRNIFIIATLLLAFLAGTMIASRSIYQTIMKQLRSILPVLAQMGNGDLTSSIQNTSKDELGMISIGINSMTQSLRNMVAHISQGSVQLSDNAQILLQTAEETLENNKRYANHSASAARATSKLASSISHHARSLSSIGTSIEQKILKMYPEQDSVHTGTDYSTYHWVLTSAKDASKELLQCSHDLQRITRASELAKESALRSARIMEGIQNKATEIHNLSKRHAAVVEKFKII